MKNLNLKKSILITFLPILSLVTGFIYEEDLSTGGSKLDFFETFPAVLNYANGQLTEFHHHTRHFPLHYLLLSVPQSLFDNVLVTKIFYLTFSFLIPIFLYLNLNLIYPSYKENNLIISFAIIFIPYFRASSIWPNAHLTAIIFLLIANYFFLRFQEKKGSMPIFLNLFFLSLSTYSIQSYSVFFLYFLFQYFNELKTKDFLLVLFLCFVFSIPGFYLVLQTPLGSKLSFTSNFSYTLLTNISITFFFILFFTFNLKNLQNFKEILIKFKFKEITILFFIFILLVFTYKIPPTLVGGGFFYKVSIFLFKNNLLFFAICFFSLMNIYQIFKNDKNLFFLIFLCNLTAIAYFTSQKYFEPLLLIIILVFSKNYLSRELIFNKNNIISYYSITIVYYLLALTNSYFAFSKSLNLD